jgi:hypothetical protein
MQHKIRQCKSLLEREKFVHKIIYEILISIQKCGISITTKVSSVNEILLQINFGWIIKQTLDIINN